MNSAARNRNRPRNRHRYRLLVALALLLAATGCLRRGPPPLEEVIVGEWVERLDIVPPATSSYARGMQFRPDGTWMESWPARPSGLPEEEVPRYRTGVYVFGPNESVFLRVFGPSPGPSATPDIRDMRRSYVMFLFLKDGKLIGFDEDCWDTWERAEMGAQEEEGRSIAVAGFDARRQLKEARRIAGQWVSSPNRWIVDFGTNMHWSSPNWRWMACGPFVVTRDREVMMRRQATLFGEYLFAEGDSLIHIDWEGATNIFHRLPAPAPPPGK